MQEDQWLKIIGNDIKNFRLRKNLDQRTVAGEAGVALSALKNLEGGKGATLRTLLRVLIVLDQQALIKVGKVDTPLRQRASKKRIRESNTTEPEKGAVPIGAGHEEEIVVKLSPDGMTPTIKEAEQGSESKIEDADFRAKWIGNMLDLCENDE